MQSIAVRVNFKGAKDGLAGPTDARRLFETDAGWRIDIVHAGCDHEASFRVLAASAVSGNRAVLTTRGQKMDPITLYTGRIPMSRAATLRSLLRSGKMILAPGAIDGITARAVERAGFPALYMTGAGTSATLGYPDYGLLTLTEMVANATRIVNSTTIPLISDADTGYGNELNVYRTVQEFERAGVAAIHIEDQVFPKRCGHLDNKEVTSREDYIAKIRAAAAARRSADFAIIARTDSRAVLGFDEAIARANLALANGADMVFVEAPQSIEEVAKVPQLVKGPCLLNVVQGGKTPSIVMSDAEKMGYALAIVPGLLMMSIVDVCDAALEEFKQTGVHPKSKTRSSPASFFARFGAAEWDARRTAFRDPLDEPAHSTQSVPAK